MKVDFHMHTTHSDGSYTPTALIQRCAEKGLGCVSVTDHDTLSGLVECGQEARKNGMELVPGVEISAQFEPGTLHILGYFLDPDDSELKEELGGVQRARKERNPQIIEKLRGLGIEISLEEVHKEAALDEELADRQIGRPHFARVLVKKGYAASLEDAFGRYLSKGRPAYMDKRRLSSARAIQVIRKAGGIASVAHPKQMRLEERELEKELARLVGEGLEAIEVYNSCQTAAEHSIYQRLAKHFGLVVTGGSDFHGASKPGVEVGILGENVSLGYEMVDALREKLAARRG